MTASANGHNYRLRNLQLFVSKENFSTYLTGGNDPKESVLTTMLPTGLYAASVYSYGLEEDAGQGNYQSVKSQLVSYSSQFAIYDGTTTTLTFQIQTDGVIVSVGTGRLDVKVQITETGPVCSPLDSTCGSGRWCPPFDLIGATPACVVAGTKALGQSCSGPVDCVGNASCFDVGSGPVCVALCLVGAGGTTCPSGGICQATAGKSYGICKRGGGAGSGGNGGTGVGGAGGKASGGGGQGASGAAGRGGNGGGNTAIESTECKSCTARECDPSIAGCDNIAASEDRALCQAAYACMTSPANACIVAGDPTVCWCGSNIDGCLTEVAATRANGPCADIFSTAAGSQPGQYNPALIYSRLIDPRFPLGRAVNAANCQALFCTDECQIP